MHTRDLGCRSHANSCDANLLSTHYVLSLVPCDIEVLCESPDGVRASESRCSVVIGEEARLPEGFASRMRSNPIDSHKVLGLIRDPVDVWLSSVDDQHCPYEPTQGTEECQPVGQPCSPVSRRP